ncbi:MAG: hypothetical protein A2Y16_04570 [Tenericutes bacterium GWF2_57_13]|nr:MAG: hypothetical protein A2Y16_04570 [Tenericutes bacterium GWF2_57_13]
MEKRIIVTGATDGIGLAVVKGFLKEGCRVIGIARNPAKAEKIVADLKNDRLSFQFGDLSSVRSVHDLGLALNRLYGKEGIDALVHVAGAVGTHRETTADDYERTFAINHLAVHQLTDLCLPLLKRRPGSRVLVVSSRAHKVGIVHFHDVNLKHGYWLLTAYAQSKLMNVLYVRDMARRIDPRMVSFYAIDPGLVDTGIVTKTTPGLERWIWSWRRKAGEPALVPAGHMVRIALDPVFAGVSGRYWKNGETIHPAMLSGRVKTMNRLHALCDDMIAKALSRPVLPKSPDPALPDHR